MKLLLLFALLLPCLWCRKDSGITYENFRKRETEGLSSIKNLVLVGDTDVSFSKITLVDRAVLVHFEDCKFSLWTCRHMIDNLQTFGFNAIQFSASWQQLEPENSVYDTQRLAFYGAISEYVHSKGMKLYMICTHPPAWITMDYEKDESLFYFKYYLMLERLLKNMPFLEYLQVFDPINNDYVNPWLRQWKHTFKLVRYAAMAAQNNRHKKLQVVVAIDADYGANVFAESLPIWSEQLETLCRATPFDAIAIAYHPCYLIRSECADHAPLNNLLDKVKSVNSSCFGKRALLTDIGYPSPNTELLDQTSKIVLDEKQQAEFLMHFFDALQPVVEANREHVGLIACKEAMDAERIPEEIRQTVLDWNAYPPVSDAYLLDAAKYYGIFTSNFTIKYGTQMLKDKLLIIP